MLRMEFKLDRREFLLAACATITTTPFSEVPAVLAQYAAAASAQTPANAQSAVRAEGIPFANGIPVMINGRGPFVFGLDTGASTAFLINPGLAQSLHLPVVSHTHLHAPGESKTNAAPSVSVVRIDDLTVAGHTFHRVVGIASPVARENGGVLCIELFKDVLVSLDYPNDRLTIAEDTLPNPDQQNVFDYVEDHTTPVLPIRLGPLNTTGHLDTGARQTKADLMVPLKLASQLPLMEPMKPSGTVADAFGRETPRYTATLDGDLRIGALTFHNPTLLISDWVPYVNLGGICNKLVIILDERQHRIRLTKAVP